MSDTQSKADSTQTSSTVEANPGTTQTQDQTSVSVSAGKDETQTKDQSATSVSQDGKDGKKADEPFELKSPDEKLIDKARVDQLVAFAKENGLTQAQAQKILDNEHSRFKDYAAKEQSRQKEEFDGWVKAVKEDKVLGGENFSANMETAKRGFDRVATPELRKILNDSGYGSHPAVVRLFFDLGKAMADDKAGGGGGSGGSSEPQTLGAILYGK
jgi:hypothetical protein